MRPVRKILVCVILSVALLFTGCKEEGPTENPQINGVTGPSVHLLNGRVIVSVAFHDIPIDLGVTIPIPRYPNSSFHVGPDFESGGLLLSLALSVMDFLSNDSAGLNPLALPGGRPLPGVASGALPAIAVTVPVLNHSVLYLGPSVIGLFVPFDGLDLAGMILTFRYFDREKRRVGNLSLVGSDLRGRNAGLLALMHPDLLGINGESARVQTLMEFYKMGYR